MRRGAVALMPNSPFRALEESSCNATATSSFRYQAAARSMDADTLLEPFAPPLRQADAQHEIADRRSCYTQIEVEDTVRGTPPAA
jgi:hypothetical protein